MLTELAGEIDDIRIYRHRRRVSLASRLLFKEVEMSCEHDCAIVFQLFDPFEATIFKTIETKH